MPKEPIAPCDNCMLTTTSTFNFLLNCCVCKRGFHHRCCNPPIPDEVLLSLLHASSKNKPGKGVKYWKCRTCRQSVTATAGPSRPPLPSRYVGSGSYNASSKTEIIVISDDEDEPPKDIIVSSHPPSHAPDPQSKPPPPPKTTAPHAPNNVGGTGRDPPRKDDAMDIDMDVFEAPPASSSTSRFGLLSPPVSASESLSVRYTSTTPFFFENDNIPLYPSSPEPELRLKTLAESKTSGTTGSGVVRGVALITPPISTRTTSPIGQGSSTPSMQVPRRTVKHDLKVLSKEFKETYHVRLTASAPSTKATSNRRRPFKSVAKPLDKNNRNPSQRTFNCFGVS